MRVRLRPGGGEWMAIASGILLWLSFPKFGHPACAWFALVPLLLAIDGATPGRGARLGWLAGFVASIGLVYWTSIVVVQFGGLPLPVGVGVMLLLCAALGLFPALFGAVVAAWVRGRGRPALLLAPIAWVATEILRAHTLFDFAWCLLGYSQQPNLPFIQVARATAVYGVSFLVVLVNAALAYVAREPLPRRRTAAAFGTVALLALVAIDGARQLRQPVAESGRIRVGLVQASVLQEDKWDPDHARDNVHRHIALTDQAAAQGARLVVWPESSLPGVYDLSAGLRELMRSVAARDHAYLLFGNDDIQRRDDAPDRVFVGAKMIDPDGRLQLRYHKMRLVPFGEYVPLESLITMGGRFSGRLVQEVGSFTPGTDYAQASVDGHPLSAFICYEAIFPDLVRQFAGRGSELLVNITNDGWYGRTSAPYQHVAMAAFRAVENGKYLVRAANTGFTVVVDPRGRILQRTQLFEQTTLVRDVPLVAGATFYATHGDVFAWGCLGAAVVLTILSLRPGGGGQQSEVGLVFPMPEGAPS